MNLKINSTISITEILPSDKPSYVKHLNASNVGLYMGSLPFPYLESDADFWIDNVIEERKTKYGRSTNWAIRHGDELIGGIGIYDYNPANIAPATDRTRRLMADDNMNKNTHHHWVGVAWFLASARIF